MQQQTSRDNRASGISCLETPPQPHPVPVELSPMFHFFPQPLLKVFDTHSVAPRHTET